MPFAQIELISSGPNNLRTTISIEQGVLEVITITIKDHNNCPVDLTKYSIAIEYGEEIEFVSCGEEQPPVQRGIYAVIKEFYGQRVPTLYKPVEIVGDTVDGTVELMIDPCDFDHCQPGLYVGEISLIDAWKRELVFPFNLELQATLGFVRPRQSGTVPLTIAEIRLWCRDVDPHFNDLLDEVEFKDSEIFAAINRVVDDWNTQPPMMRRHIYTARTFPFRSIWIDGAISYLYEIAARWYSRNRLDYSAGGVSVQHRSKYAEYMDQVKWKKAEYKEKMQRQKQQLNLDQGYGSSGHIPKLP